MEGIQPGGGRRFVPLNGRLMPAWMLLGLAGLFAVAGLLVLLTALLGEADASEPSQQDRIVGIWFAAAAVGASAALVRLGTAARGRSGPQAEAHAVAVRGTPTWPIVIGGVRFSDGGRLSAAWLEILDRASGQPLGWVEAPQLFPTFHPGLPRVLVGERGGAVALEDAQRRHRLLPTAFRPAPPDAAPWSEPLVRALGWDLRSPAESGVGELPSVVETGKVSVAQPPEVPMRGIPDLPEPIVALSARHRRRGPLVFVASLVTGGLASMALAFIDLEAALATPVTGIAVLTAVNAMRLRRMRSLVRAHLPGLDPTPTAVPAALLQFASVEQLAPEG